MPKIFNKKNVKKFADSLYYEKRGYIYYRPMCRVELAKANGEFVGCILGELYEEFEEKPIARLLTKRELLEKHNSSYREFEDDEYLSSVHDDKLAFRKYYHGFKINKISISKILSNRAIIKNKQDISLLYYKIYDLMILNDSILGDTEKSKIKRAKILQKELHKIADKYLI